MKQKIICLALLWLTASFGGKVSGAELSALSGPYLGQDDPGAIPKSFAPEILMKSKPEWAFCGVFSPNQREFYYSSFDIGKNAEQIMWMRRPNDTWSLPVSAPFNTSHNSNDSRISPDGRTLYFRSKRPLPGNNAPEKRAYTWYVTRSGENWEAPRPLLLGGVPRQIGYLGVSQSGTLYFSYRGEAGSGNPDRGADIHTSTYVNGSYSKPKNMGSEVNSPYSEGDVFVAPNESYLIFTVWDHPEASGKSDLYISFRQKNGSWSKAKNMGAPINTQDNEGCPAVSPDGDYFFYFKVDLSGQAPRGSTYWVDAEVIQGLLTR